MAPPIQTETTTAHPTYDTTYIWTISLVAALGGLLFGYDWVVIGGAKPFYEKFFGLYDPAQQGWAMGCALVGCLLGAMLSGVLTDKFGRKPILLLSAMLFTLSSIGTALSNTFVVFVTWRIAGGLSIGLASRLSPMYIAQCFPALFRGKLVSINQLPRAGGSPFAPLLYRLVARPF